MSKKIKSIKDLQKQKDPFADATFLVDDKKVRQSRFWREVATMLHPPKKRVVVIDTVAKLLRACPNLEVFGEELKKYVITKGGKLMLWEDWYKKPHPMINRTEDAGFEIIVKQLPAPKKKHR